jgi:hypothetical protein
MERHRLAHRFRAALTIVAASIVGIGLSAGPVQADGCANAGLRAQNQSTQLPDCRAYELVTSPYKEGFEGIAQTFTDDGALSYISPGVFAGSLDGQLGNQYVARRASSGWTTSALAPPAALYRNPAGPADFMSADLRSLLQVLIPRDDPAGRYGYYLRGPDGVFKLVGMTDIPGVSTQQPFRFLATPDLSHVVFGHAAGSGTAEAAAMYEFVGTDNAGPARPVSIDNRGQQVPAQACPNGISADGRVIFFSSGCYVGVPQVWARVGGSTTIAVSGSHCTRTAGEIGGVCNAAARADYAGATADGSQVLFTTTQQLVNADTDTTSDLYACGIPAGVPSPTGAANPCPSLARLSGPAPDAQVESVVAMSDDGSRVFFVAQGALADNLGVNGLGPVAGGGNHNLYLWQKDAAHPAGATTFVAKLDADDVRAEMTRDGRYLVFTTATSVVTAGPGADGDADSDVYRYDPQTQSVVRISTSTAGGGGNGAGFAVTFGQTVGRRQAMTADGATVVFQTNEALSPRDIDGISDVYAWHDGLVSLISDGITGATNPWITSSGQDIYFISTGRLIAADRDANTDVYDARVDGGFDLNQPQACAGDACQGAPSSAPGLGVPELAPQADGSGAAAVAPAFSVRKVSATQRTRLAAGGKVTLAVATNTSGTISAVATATIAGRSSTVASGRTATAAGTAPITLTLSAKARKQLKSKGKLTVKIAVSHSKVALSRALTLSLTRAKAKSATKK